VRLSILSLSGPAGHPLHPFVAPLPVGAFTSSLIFDILTRTRPDELPWLVDGAWWLIGVGLIGAGIAAGFGVLDLLRIPRRSSSFKLATTHATLNLAAAVLFGIGYAWRAGDHVELGQTRWGQLALSAVAVALLAISVWIGQTLSYRDGVRVDRRGRSEPDGTRMG
jgi:uncharacterized membrane protein